MSVPFKVDVQPETVDASLDGTFLRYTIKAKAKTNSIRGNKMWGILTFLRARLVGSSGGRKLTLIEVRRHVSLESQIIVESQFAARVQALILGLDDG